MWRAAGRRPGLRATLTVLALSLVAAACASGRPLDVPPGQRVVLGRVDLSRFQAPEALLEFVREDGTFRRDVRVAAEQPHFLTTLPPGRYRLAAVRLVDSRLSLPNLMIFHVPVAFEIGVGPAVYLGTLRLVTGLGQQPTAEVVDDYPEVVPRLRARYPRLPSPVDRSPFRAG